jgi:hypothetical protein
MVPELISRYAVKQVKIVPTNVDVRLVTSEGCVVPYTVHVSAGTLHTQSILHWVDATLVLRSAHENS